MRLRSLLSSLVLSSALFAAGQTTKVNPNTGINWPQATGSGAPTSSCTFANYGQPYQRTDVTPNTYYTCGNDGWQVRGASNIFSSTPGGVWNTSNNTSRNMTATDLATIYGYVAAAQAAVPSLGNTMLAGFIPTQLSGPLKDRSGNGNDCTLASGSGITLDGLGTYFGDNTGQYNCPAALNSANTYAIVFQVGARATDYASNPFLIWPSGSLGTHAFALSTTPPNLSGPSGSFGVTVQDRGTGGGGTYIFQSTDLYALTHSLIITCPPGAPPVSYLDGNRYTGTNFISGLSCNGIMSGGNFSFGPNAKGMYLASAYFFSGVATDSDAAALANSTIIAARNQGFPFLPYPYKTNIKWGAAGGDSIVCEAYAPVPGTCELGLGLFGTVAPTSWALVFTNYLTVATGYTPAGFGYPGAYVENQIVYAPKFYTGLCNSIGGKSEFALMEHTNNFEANYTGSALAFAQHVADYDFGMLNNMATPSNGSGCDVGLIGMLDRMAASPGTLGPDGAGNSYEQDAFNIDGIFQQQWKARGLKFYVDPRSTFMFGSTNSPLSSLWYSNGGGGSDYVHPSSPTGNVAIAKGYACNIDNINSPALGSVAPITATSYTWGCGAEQLNFDTHTAPITATLMTGMWQTGRDRKACNASPSGANLLTVNAPTYTFTGSTHSNTTLDVISNVLATGAPWINGIQPGDSISGAGIPANTTVASVVSVTPGSGSITLSQAATATAAGVTFTTTEPFVGGATSTTVAVGACKSFVATFNQSNAFPQNNWQITN